MTYAEALEGYGSDRPDLRYSLRIQDWTDELPRRLDFKVVQGAVEAGGRIRGFRLEGGASLSRKEIEGLEALAKKAGAPGLLWVKRTEEGGSGPLSRFMAEEDYQSLGLEAGDLALVAAGPGSDHLPGAGRHASSGPHGSSGVEPDDEDAWVWVGGLPDFRGRRKVGL